MRYCDLCQAFYIAKGSSGLNKKKSQHDIGEFFALLTVDKEKNESILPTSEDAFAKWFSGNTSPRQEIWEAVKKSSPKEYAAKLKEAINTKNLEKVAENLKLGIRKGEAVDVDRFSSSIAELVFSMAEGNGETDKSAKDFYSASSVGSPFSGYIRYAQEQYNLMKLIGSEDEVLLEDYFVCNTIGEKRRLGVDRSKTKEGYIDDATIEKIRTHYQYRHLDDNRKVLLLGSGGSGKTLMLQHLFLDSLSRYHETGILPVFIELRHYLTSDTLVGVITRALNMGGGEFTEEEVDELLKNAKLHILFDGFDEIDATDVPGFQKKLKEFAAKYSKIMIIVASREVTDAKAGVSGFVKMYVWPFDNEQSMKLVKKVLDSENNAGAKDVVLDYIEHGFIVKDGIFASHPMMLTFVAKNARRLEEYRNNHLLFYAGAYKAMVSGHDENKPYSRIFQSVDDAESFTKVFSEFCAKSYEVGKNVFDEEEFESFFSQLKTYFAFENPHKMNLKSFRQDVCSTACMMYEENDKTYYIDPGFQKYLFAHYYIQATPEEVKEMGKALLNTSRFSFDDYEALDMLYGKAKDKFEFMVLYPFLQAIFKEKSEKDSLAKYLEYGYDQILYTVIDEEKIKKATGKESSPYELGLANFNEPRTVILDYIFKIINNQHTAIFVTWDKAAEAKENELSPVYGRFEDKQFTLSTLFSDVLQDEHFGIKYEYVVDKKGAPIEMGMTYSVNTQDIVERMESYDGLVETLINDGSDIYKGYIKVREYYDSLRRRLKRDRVY